MTQPPSFPGQTPADARAVAAAQQPVVVVCQYTRWIVATMGLLSVALTFPALATAHTTAALVAAAVVSAMSVAVLVRAFLVGTVRAAGGTVVIRSALWTHRYAAADIDHFEAHPGFVGARQRLVLAAVTLRAGTRSRTSPARARAEAATWSRTRLPA